MKNKYLIFGLIVLFFLALGIFFFIRSLKEIKEVEREIQRVEIEKKEEKPKIEPPPKPLEEKKVLEEDPNPIINFKFKTLDGKVLSLNSFKEKLIFITFWATWCRFCAMELESLQKLYNEYKGKDVAFVMLSQEDPSRILNYMKKFNYNFPAYVLTERPPISLKYDGIPANFILDKKGNILLRKIGLYDWSSKEAKETLESLLK